MNILITGAQGQLGVALARRLGDQHQVEGLSRKELDVTSLDACRAALHQTRPDVLLNCAAHTAVDRAESEPGLAFAINAAGAGNLAQCCAEMGVFPIHFSTDYVFDGTLDRPYTEQDATQPTSTYGDSKLQGEIAVARESAKYLIFRLSWVYSNDGTNFYKTMLRLANERPTLRVVADQFGTPNFTGDIANAVAHVLQLPLAELERLSGLYHLSAAGVASWHDFAVAIVSGAGFGDRVAVEAIPTSEYPTAAKRPAYSALDGSRFAATFGWASPSWQDGLQRCLAARN